MTAPFKLPLDKDSEFGTLICDAKNIAVCSVATRAEADYIVRAVNCHDDLIAALELAQGRLNRVPMFRKSSELIGELSKIRAVLARAKGDA